MKKYLLLFALLLIITSCNSQNEHEKSHKRSSSEIFFEIVRLIKGNYQGYSSDETEKNMAIEHSTPKGNIELDSIYLTKTYYSYVPLTDRQYGQTWTYGYKKVKAEEVGSIDSYYSSYDSSKNDPLVIIGKWSSSGYSTCTFNIRPLISKKSNEIYIIMFTNYWEVWGYKTFSKEVFDKICELFKEHYKNTHYGEQPWLSSTEDILSNNSNKKLVNNNKGNSETIISQSDIEHFIDSIIKSANEKDISSVINNYSEKVNYFRSGDVNKAFILEDKKNYLKLWDELNYELTGDIEISDYTNEIKKVKFNLNFSMYNSKKNRRVEGISESILLLKPENGELKIIDEKGKVVSRRS